MEEGSLERRVSKRPLISSKTERSNEGDQQCVSFCFRCSQRLFGESKCVIVQSTDGVAMIDRCSMPRKS